MNSEYTKSDRVDDVYEWYDTLLYYMKTEEISRLVNSGIRRHAPISIVFILSRLFTRLKQFASPYSRQKDTDITHPIMHSVQPIIHVQQKRKQKGKPTGPPMENQPTRPPMENRPTRPPMENQPTRPPMENQPTGYPVEAQTGGGRKKDNKDKANRERLGGKGGKSKNSGKGIANKNGKIKSEAEILKNCTFMSVPYQGESSISDSLSKIDVVYPWYEYALYVFRHETKLRHLCEPSALSKLIPADHVSSVKDALFTIEYIKKNIMFLHLERAKLIHSSQQGLRVRQYPYIEFIFPGFFLDTLNSAKPVPIEATHVNEGRIQAALGNRSLEYGSRIPIDKFLIVHIELFRQMVGDTLSIDTSLVSESFSHLLYDSETDEFGLVFENDGITVRFRISGDGSYPQPMVSSISDLRDFGGNYIFLVNGDAFINHEMISKWIENDGRHLGTWYETTEQRYPLPSDNQ